ncbi:MAG: DUF2244 domain-containing protein [Marinosulfonomonas sp.]|nr:DUF2244 domain-containing protein [Marinosulfonomonas sp.]
MPYEWNEQTNLRAEQSATGSGATGDPRWRQLTLWPYRSLPRKGFVWFIAITVSLMAVPLLALLGTLALWGLLPFLVGAVALFWYFVERNYRDAALTETLTFGAELVELTRTEPDGSAQHWRANPYWVRIDIHPMGGLVENYITLTGNGRTVEIGAFLSPDERKALFKDLTEAFSGFRG